MSHLQKLNCRCEVTSVKFICDGTFLLTAQGPFLTIYDSTKGFYINSYQLLCANKIHGIRTHQIVFNNTKYLIIICFGGRELSISIFNPTNKLINRLHSPLLLNDWVFDTKLLNKSNNKSHNLSNKTFELAIGMMHGQVLIYSLSFTFDDTNNNNKISLSYSYTETILNENTSILYSLSFYGSNRNNLMIAAGDCFNHLLLWNVFEMEPNKKHENKTKIKFRGRRKGAIYCISWSSNGKYLCYVSDDRSVQLWKFLNSQSLQMVYRVYGHQARVFKCLITNDGQYVISISEDSTCRVWNYDGELIDIFEFRYGQIWSLDICQKKIQNINLYHVALGGADSSIRLHYFLSSNTENDIMINSKSKNDLNNIIQTNQEFIPFEHHINSKAFYQINLPHKYFPHQSIKKKNRGKKRRDNKNVIRMMIIDKEKRIIFATGSDIYRVTNLSAFTNKCRWEKIISLKDIFNNKQHQHDEITCMKLCKDLFSDYGHYKNINDANDKMDESLTKMLSKTNPEELLQKIDITTSPYQQIPEDASDSFSAKKRPLLKTIIKKTDFKIAENLHLEYERWLIIGTKVGRISIIDLTCNQTALSYRAHDIGIISLYSCITSFQPETLEINNLSETKRKYKSKIDKLIETNPNKKRNKQMRFSLSASDLHEMISDPNASDEYISQTGNSSLMLFTSDGNGNIMYWCFPLSQLQKPNIKPHTTTHSQTSSYNSIDDMKINYNDNDTISEISAVSNASSISVKFDSMHAAIKSSATFMNPSKKQISAFCYLPPPKNIIVVGDVRGSVMLFSLLNLQQRLVHKPMQVLKSMHGREPVSCIKVLSGIKYIHDRYKEYKSRHQLREESDMDDEDKEESFYACGSDEKKYHIVSGGKDGKIVEYTFLNRKEYDELGGSSSLIHSTTGEYKSRKSRSDHNLKSMVNDELIFDGEILIPIRPIASTSLSAIDNIIINKNNEMICTGFRSTDFIVWNYKQDYVLFRWNCGGMKRPHGYQMLYYDDEKTEGDNKIALNPCRGWIFAYTNSNLSNAIAVFHLDLPLSIIPLGSLSRPYHSSEIHALHWLLSPKEIFKMCQTVTDDIFEEIEEFVSSKQNLHNENINDQKKDIINIVNKPLSEYFKKVMVASSGEDGLIEIISILNGTNKLETITTTTATSSNELNDAISRPRSSRSYSSRSSVNFGFHSKDLMDDTIENDWKYSNVFDSEMYSEWILNFKPNKHINGNVINLQRESIMEQNGGSRFPLKCCDMVRKSTGNSYLFFSGGAKEYLQGYEVTYNENKPEIVEWKSLCCTGGDINKRDKQRGKRWKNKDINTENDRLSTMDLRIKSICVIPSPKYSGKWLIITGNSCGTIRCYTFDEYKPSEFQFEGQDSNLHKDNNSSSPVLSLSSTYSSETCYHFPNIKTMSFSPFNHIDTTNIKKKQKQPINKNNKNISTSFRKDIYAVPQLGKRAMSDNAATDLNINANNNDNDNNRIISGYSELPPHLIFSGATDGWIRIWFWDIDSHCIQLVERLAIHQSGVNTISASWLDAKFINKNNKNNNKKNKKHIKQSSSPISSKILLKAANKHKNNNNIRDGLLTRRLGILSGGDDQSLTLIIADFESTISMSRASRKRAIHQKHHLLRNSLTINNLKLSSENIKSNISSTNNTGWKLNVIREIPINTAHVASIRSVSITPIITPNIVNNYFNNNENESKENDNNNNNNYRMNEMLLLSTGDDQMLKCWSYKFRKQLFKSESIINEQNIELLDEIKLDIGLPNVLSMYYIYNSGILLSIGGQGIQIITLPFDKYLFKKIYYNKQIRDKYRKENNKEKNKYEDNRSSASFDSSFSQNAPQEAINSNNIGYEYNT